MNSLEEPWAEDGSHTKHAQYLEFNPQPPRRRSFIPSQTLRLGGVALIQ